MSHNNIKLKHGKLKLFLVSLLAVFASIFGLNTASVNAWGPERTTYTNESPAPYATFNSITNNKAVGDERNFVRVRELGDNTKYSDEVEVTPGKEYEVYIYYHNNAATNTNETGLGIATATNVVAAYPTVLKTSERGMISAILTWSYVDSLDANAKAKDGKVWDEAYLTTKTDGVVMRYKTGSAVIHNGGKANGSVLPSSLFTNDGAYIGYNKLAGTLPGCAEYSGYITYTLVAELTDSKLEKKVSTDGSTWVDSVNVKPGDYVTYRVKFENTGNTNFTNVIFKDAHDNGLTLRTGSTKIFNLANQNGKTIDDIIDLSGYNTGDLAAGALVQVIYQAQVSTDKSYCGKTLKNTITANFNSNQSKTDSANVKVVCESEPVAPTCETNPEMEGCEKTCKTNPEMEGCQEIPSTGPVEITLAIVVVLGILGGCGYLYKTRKTLKTVEDAVKGEGPQDESK